LILNQIIIDEEFKGLCPALSAEERKQLEKNIIEEGCRDALVIWKNIIIDGHNRYEICIRNSIEYKTVEMDFPDRESVIDWIINNQLGRRNLTKEAQSYLRGLQYSREKKKPGAPEGNKNAEKQIDNNLSIVSGNSTAQRLAEQHNVTHQTIKNDEKYAKAIDTITEELGEDVKEKILSHEINVTKKDIAQLAKWESEQRQKVIAMIVKQEAKGVRDAIIRLNKEKAKALNETPIATPKGKYKVIEIDPPWKMNGEEAKSQVMQYPLMDMEELKKLKSVIDEMADENCHLYLWAINPMLPEAFELMEVWGFKYKTCITWIKSNGFGTGHYFRGQTEHVLFGIRGKLNTLENDQANYLEAPRTKHSEKPEKFYEIVERMSPEPRIRLFARAQRDGWVSWGNEI